MFDGLDQKAKEDLFDLFAWIMRASELKYGARLAKSISCDHMGDKTISDMVEHTLEKFESFVSQLQGKGR